MMILRILILDDDEISRRVMKNYLEKKIIEKGHEPKIVEASTATQAWYVCQDENFSGAVIDIVLEDGITGLKFANSWPLDEKRKRIAIHTGLCDPTNVKKITADYPVMLMKGDRHFDFSLACWLETLVQLEIEFQASDEQK